MEQGLIHIYVETEKERQQLLWDRQYVLQEAD